MDICLGKNQQIGDVSTKEKYRGRTWDIVKNSKKKVEGLKQ